MPVYVIIIGGGGIGYELARNLSLKDQDVVLIEKKPELARRIGEELDIMILEGDGANGLVLEKAGIKSAKMLIAVTEVDEVNIIACMLAKRYGVPITVGRVRDVDYFQSTQVISQDQFGIDLVINPERVAALEISKILHFPDASDIEYFNRGKVMMLGVIAGEEAGICEQPLRDLPLPPGCIVVGISGPGDKFIIPGGDDVIEPGDKIYLLGSSKTLKDVSWLLHHEKTLVKRVIIIGGGMIGFQLAKMLESSRQNFTIKIIEKSVERCQFLSQELKHTLVLEGDATDLALLKQEEMEFADAIIATTGDDKTNILASVLARQFNVNKIVAEVMDPQYVPVYTALGIDTLINPRLLAAAQILRFTRKEDVVALSILKDEKAEVLELVLHESARVAQKKVSEANFPRGMLIGSIVRHGEVIVPHGNTVLQAGDHLVIFALPQISKHLDRYFASLKDNKSPNWKNKVQRQEG